MKSIILALSFVLGLSAPAFAWQQDGTSAVPAKKDYIDNVVEVPVPPSKVEQDSPLKPYIRDDQVVIDTTHGLPKLPEDTIVIRQLVDSKTTVDGTYLYERNKGFFQHAPKLVANKKIEYKYLVDATAMKPAVLADYVNKGIISSDGNNHYFLTLNSKIEGVRDIRNQVLAHPKIYRGVAFVRRTYDRAKPILVPLSVIVNALIIRG